MSQELLSIEDASARIATGAPLLLAGSEEALRRLPAGDWVAGTIPYFMTDQGGLRTHDQVFVTDVPEVATGATIAVYDAETLPRIYVELPDNGFGIMIVPSGSTCHLHFAIEAPTYDGFAMSPLAGWVSGVDLDDLGTVTPKVFDGRTLTAHEDGVVVMQVSLPPDKAADIGIVNLFSQGDGAVIEFPEAGFTGGEATIDGATHNFAEYVEANGWDTRWPLVADYYGAMVNVSFQDVDTDAGQVALYAPVFPGMTYRHAKPVDDYVQDFTAELALGHAVAPVSFSCNCILNYVHSGLEGRKTEQFVGPVTFGEIAYQLLNQTMVYVSVVDVGS